MARKASGKQTVYLTDRALRDIAGIEMRSIEQFGKSVAAKYIDKLEAGIGLVSDHPELLWEESGFHKSLKFYRIEKHVLVCETAVEDKIIILTILHVSMDVPTRLAELEPKLSLELGILLKQLVRTSR